MALIAQMELTQTSCHKLIFLTEITYIASSDIKVYRPIISVHVAVYFPILVLK